MSADGLTEKQRQVLELHNEGKNPTEIAEALGISSQGVHGHFRRLRSKGLMPEEPGRRRPTPNGRHPVSADDALEAVRETVRTQRQGLEDRKTAIATEIKALKTQDEEIDQALAALDAMVGTHVTP